MCIRDRIEGGLKTNDMIRNLLAAQEATVRTARKLYPLADSANVQPSADLLTLHL